MQHNHPKDILVELFANLNPIQLYKVGLVCRQWRKASLMNKLWIKFLDPDKTFPYMMQLPESNRVNEGFYHKLYLEQPELRLTKFRDYDKKGITYSCNEITTSMNKSFNALFELFGTPSEHIKLRDTLLNPAIVDQVRIGKFPLSLIIDALGQVRADYLRLLVESLSTQTATRLLQLNMLTENDLVFLTNRYSFSRVAKFVSYLDENNVAGALIEAKINLKQYMEKLSIKATSIVKSF